MTGLRARTTLAMLGIIIVFVLLALLMLPPIVSAQVARTPRSRDTGSNQLQAAQGNIQATVQAQSTQIAATLQAGVDNAAVQVTAASESLSAGASNVAATVEYVATQAAQDVDSIAATVAALSSAYADWPDELDALVTALAGQGSVSIDGDTLTATVYVSEAQANELLDLVIEGAGYDPALAELDTKADGTIDVILTDISSDFSGTVVMTYQVTANPDGTVSFALLGVTLNGNPLPTTMLPDELTSAADLAVYAASVQPMLSATMAYSVESIAVSEDGILLVVSLTLTP